MRKNITIIIYLIFNFFPFHYSTGTVLTTVMMDSIVTAMRLNIATSNVLVYQYTKFNSCML